MTANGISGFGNEMSAVAIPWFALVLTEEDYAVGVVATASMLPLIIAATLGGVLVDRFGFRTMSVASDIASGVTVAMIPLLHVTTGISLPVLALLAFLGVLLDAPGTTARQSLLPDLAAAAGSSLERANSVFESVLQAKNMVGPVAAGLLIAAASATTVLWIDAATFGVSAMLIGLTIQRGQQRRAESDQVGVDAPRPGWRADLLTGFRFLKHETTLLSLAMISLFNNMLIMPVFLVFAPVYARREMNGAAELGIMLAAFGATALVGAMIYGWVGRTVRRRSWYTFTTLCGMSGYIVLALRFGLIGGVLAMGLMGIMSGAGRPLGATLRQERTPRHLRGRVFGVLSTLSTAATPVGTVLGGVLIAVFGLSVALWCVAGMGVAIFLTALLLPTLRAERMIAPNPPLNP